MPKLFRGLLGFVLLLATIGLTTCQSLVKAEPAKTPMKPSAMQSTATP